MHYDIIGYPTILFILGCFIFKLSCLVPVLLQYFILGRYVDYVPFIFLL